MTPEQIKEVLTNVVNELNAAGDMVGVLDPAIIPYLAIGKAVDGLIPGLAATVANWIQGNPPTSADLNQKSAELAVLGDKGGV